ncbi:MAG: flagellar assembly protein T N-terminal domain-containing protein [Deltaproteobacteria bacterium]|nr:flagellar assembly protein T N-terminal domain-containing protein [Deltaproteobacteria bacterium]MBZ0218907.1 flagellar assembly protein T N-terminal domain-containing protein [Deltaproteobacteria bacterium]
MLLVSVSLASFSDAEDDIPITIEAIGTASVADSDISSARDGAIADALRKAVEQAVGMVVSSETVVESFEVLRDSVYTNATGYVKSYDVLEESRSGGTYQVRIRAVVSAAGLEGDLDAMGLLQRKVERPRVLFMISEQMPGDSGFTSWWRPEAYLGRDSGERRVGAATAALMELFLRKGFNVVDIAGSPEAVTPTDPYWPSDISGESAREAAGKVNAEIVVFGKAVASEGPRTGGTAMVTWLADITAQAVRVDDGSLLASGRGHATSRHISAEKGPLDAFYGASEELAEGLVRDISSKWAGPVSFTIKLKVADYAGAVEFKRLLRTAARGVLSIYQRRFEGNEAFFEVESKVPAQAIADEISRLRGFRVTGAAQNAIEVEAYD